MANGKPKGGNVALGIGLLLLLGGLGKSGSSEAATAATRREIPEGPTESESLLARLRRVLPSGPLTRSQIQAALDRAVEIGDAELVRHILVNFMDVDPAVAASEAKMLLAGGSERERARIEALRAMLTEAVARKDRTAIIRILGELGFSTTDAVIAADRLLATRAAAPVPGKATPIPTATVGPVKPQPVDDPFVAVGTEPGALLTLEDFFAASGFIEPEPVPVAAPVATEPGALLTLEDFFAASGFIEPEPVPALAPVATQPGALLTLEDFFAAMPAPEVTATSSLSGFSAGELFNLEASGALTTEQVAAELTARNQ